MPRFGIIVGIAEIKVRTAAVTAKSTIGDIFVKFRDGGGVASALFVAVGKFTSALYRPIVPPLRR